MRKLREIDQQKARDLSFTREVNGADPKWRQVDKVYASATKARLVIVTLTMLLFEGAALASPPAYFYKPSVERSTFDQEFGKCVELAGGAKATPHSLYTPNLYAAAIGGFFGGIMASRQRRAMVESVMRICMADRGYRRVIAPKGVLRELASKSDIDRAGRLFELATLPTPLGEVLPR
jgi:hypothetical protein